MASTKNYQIKTELFFNFFSKGKMSDKKQQRVARCKAFAAATDWAKSQGGSSFQYQAGVAGIDFEKFNNIRQGRVDPPEECISALDGKYFGFRKIFDDALKEQGQGRKKTVEELTDEAKADNDELRRMVAALQTAVIEMQDKVRRLEESSKKG